MYNEFSRRGQFIGFILLLFIGIYLWCNIDLVDFKGTWSAGHSAVSEDSADGELLNLDDILITVKTTKKNYPTRLKLILKTWWNYAKNQTYFFSDAEDEDVSRKTGGRLVNTDCGPKHNNADLCCKFGREYDAFNESGKKWWCHFDDDNYVNIKLLLQLLRGFDWRSDYYIGRPSLDHIKESRYLTGKVHYWFATGGAGICISQSLSKKMSPWCRNGMFSKTCVDLHQPDDCTTGFIINNRLGVNLTWRNDFNSHLQNMTAIKEDELPHQVTMSYAFRPRNSKLKMVRINPDYKSMVFPLKEDATRFLSFHCLAFPETAWCPKK